MARNQNLYHLESHILVCYPFASLDVLECEPEARVPGEPELFYWCPSNLGYKRRDQRSNPTAGRCFQFNTLEKGGAYPLPGACSFCYDASGDQSIGRGDVSWEPPDAMVAGVLI